MGIPLFFAHSTGGITQIRVKGSKGTPSSQPAMASSPNVQNLITIVHLCQSAFSAKQFMCNQRAATARPLLPAKDQNAVNPMLGHISLYRYRLAVVPYLAANAVCQRKSAVIPAVHIHINIAEIARFPKI